MPRPSHAAPLAVVLAFAVCVAPRAQTPREIPDQPIFRLGVSLVQLDAVAVDRKGRHVTDLAPSEFQVFQDGHEQQIVAADYIATDDRFVPLPSTDDGGGAVRSARLQPRDARRTVAIVVDDMRMSFESVYYTRYALKKFVTSSLGDGDLVGMLTTSGAPGTSARFSYSRPELQMAIGRLRFSMFGLRGASILDPVDGLRSRTFGESYREEAYAASAVQRIASMIDQLREQPGRKAVVLVSEGFTMFGAGVDNGAVDYEIRHLVDHANRAGVVIYALDPRGLVVGALSAADNTSGMSPQEAGMLAADRRAALRETQDALRFIAGETGGFAVVDNNDLAGGLRRVLDDQRGYYLIGYQPEPGTFGVDTSGRYRRLKLTVTRKGVKVRARTGFYAIRTE